MASRDRDNLSDVGLTRRAAIHAALGEALRLAIVEALRLTDRTPSDLSAQLGIGTNLFAHHLGILKAAGVCGEVVSSGDRRRRYLQLNPGALDDLAQVVPVKGDRVLFVCTRNSARSQIAAAIYAKTTGKSAASAGTHPARRVHPLAVKIARRHGLHIEDAKPRPMTSLPFAPDLLITVCDQANEEISGVGAPRLHWSIPDPVAVGNQKAFESAYVALERKILLLASAAA